MANQDYNSPFTGDLSVPTAVSYNFINLTQNSVLIWPDYGSISVPATNTFYFANIIDVASTNINLQLALPPGIQGSLGADVLIRNTGSFPIVVTDANGGNNFTIPTGIAQWFYLVANSTFSGVWRSVTFGAGVSAQNAAGLAGGGIEVDTNAQLAVGFPVFSSAAAPVLNDQSWGNTYVWTGGSGTFTLPVPSKDAWTILVRNSGTGQLTLSTTNSYQIDGAATVQLLPGESTFVIFKQVTSSTGYFVTIGRNRLTNFYFSSAVWDITSTGATLDLRQYATIIQTYRASGTSQPTTVYLPPNTNTYYIINTTTQTINFQVGNPAAGNTVGVAANTSASAICDGTNIYASNVIPYGGLTLNSSDKTSPSLKISGQQTGFYANSGYAGITVNAGAAYLEVQQNNIYLTPGSGGNVVTTLDGGYIS